MDKITNYRRILDEVLESYASIKKSLTPNIKTQKLIDRESDHYQLLSIGWHNNRFVYMISLHFDIVNDKIWIQQNNTDVLIADELVERGVPKTDIVLGFVPEKVRHFEGFATT
ncbi:MAG: XisI protein [Runella slithyformis]|nr:MAG: XisI protein [Runella slithyformis]TAF30006.1 MAG: XisI protein [Runella slithyformis]TAF49122.1 MAG: XisI protein [Runella slithyformis]TAF83617.1 MAG: XisI protein [Runella slithyformis]TAG70092.1 MAG: XisI protein [Runella slithyformis]